METKILKTIETRLEFYLTESDIEEILLDFTWNKLLKTVGKTSQKDYDYEEMDIAFDESPSGGIVGARITVAKNETQEEEI